MIGKRFNEIFNEVFGPESGFRRDWQPDIQTTIISGGLWRFPLMRDPMDTPRQIGFLARWTETTVTEVNHEAKTITFDTE